MMRAGSLGLAGLTAYLLISCKAVGPNFVSPKEPVPDTYAGAVAGAHAAPTTAATGAAAQSFWWQEFHDPELDRLIKLTTGGNLDLKMAYLRIVESRAQLQAARAQGLPGLNASASYAREQFGLGGILKSEGVANNGTLSPSTQALLGSATSPVNLYTLGFDASWELDLFGKVRRSVEAAKAQTEEAIESRNDLVVTLQAEVAQAYFQLRSAQELQAITQSLIAEQGDVVTLTRDQQAHGLASDSSVETAAAQLANLESQLPPFDQSITSARHSLAVLTGQFPEALDAEFGDSGALPPLPAAPDVGIPATLARRRPDIRSAEAELHAATADVGVSVAALFPDISLSGSAGLRNIDTGYLFNWSSKFYSAGPKISVPIFQGGAWANVRLTRAQAAEAAVNYRKTVLTALAEVEDGLSTLQDDSLRTAALKKTFEADQRAVDINMKAYEKGIVNYVTVLTLQLQTIQAHQQLAQSILAQSIDLVKLYKALGGGWQTNDAAPADSSPPPAS